MNNIFLCYLSKMKYALCILLFQWGYWKMMSSHSRALDSEFMKPTLRSGGLPSRNTMICLIMAQRLQKPQKPLPPPWDFCELLWNIHSALQKRGKVEQCFRPTKSPGKMKCVALDTEGEWGSLTGCWVAFWDCWARWFRKERGLNVCDEDQRQGGQACAQVLCITLRSNISLALISKSYFSIKGSRLFSFST